MQGRRIGLLCLVLLGGWTGCATKVATPENNTWNSRFQPLSVGEERKGQIEIAMVQVPKEEALKSMSNTSGVDLASLNQIIVSYADEYLSQGIWKDVDEQVLPLESKPKLQANGFRVGVIRNALPTKLQQLLGAPQTCPHMRRLVAKADHEWFWPLGVRTGTTELNVVVDGAKEKKQLDQVEFGLLIQANSLSEGRTKLLFTPMVRHGSQVFQAKPNRERSGWEVSTDRPEEKYVKIAWEIVLKPNEYVVIGGWDTQGQSLGKWSFVEADTARHRLLVIRGIPSAEPFALGLDAKGPLPLALQSLLPPRQGQSKVPPSPAREVRGQSP